MADKNYKKYFELQRKLSSQIILESKVGNIKYIAGVDVSYVKRVNLAFATIVVLNYKTLEIVEKKYHISQITFPYIPGLLSFREIPPILECIKKCKISPDIYICDGQGIAHPRKMGLATHLGIILNRPTIGCAKKKLVGHFTPPPLNMKSWSPLWYKGEQIGAVLRNKPRVKPIFISPGHLVDINKSIEVVRNTSTKYRLPEPTRLADKFTKELKKNYLGL